MPPLRIFDANWDEVDTDDSAPGYTELPPWPDEMRVAGSLRQWQRTLFEGDELVGVLWRSEPGTVKIDHYPYDQAVTVLRGDLTLTEAGCSVFVLPRGFQGLWTMEHGVYEEFIVVERSTFLSHQSDSPAA